MKQMWFKWMRRKTQFYGIFLFHLFVYLQYSPSGTSLHHLSAVLTLLSVQQGPLLSSINSTFNAKRTSVVGLPTTQHRGASDTAALPGTEAHCPTRGENGHKQNGF